MRPQFFWSCSQNNQNRGSVTRLHLSNISMVLYTYILYAVDTIKEDPPQEEETTSPKTRTDSVSTTVSEVEYRHKRSYRELSIKKVQRKSSLQTFARENTTEICMYALYNLVACYLY